MLGLLQWFPSAAAISMWALFMTAPATWIWEVKKFREVRVAVSVEEVHNGLNLQMRKVAANDEKELAFIFSCPKRNDSCVAVSKRLYLINDDRVGAIDAPRSMHVAMDSPADGWEYTYPEEHLKDDYIPLLVTNLDLTLQQNWYGRLYISAEADMRVEFFLVRLKSTVRGWSLYLSKRELIALHFITNALGFVLNLLCALMILCLVIPALDFCADIIMRSNVHRSRL